MAWNNPVDIGAVPFSKPNNAAALVQANAIARRKKPSAQAARPTSSAGDYGMFPGVPNLGNLMNSNLAAAQRASGGGGSYGLLPQASTVNSQLAKQLSDEYQKAMNEGKAANLARYDQGMAGYDTRRTDALAASDQMIGGYNDLYGRSMGAADQQIGGYGSLAAVAGQQGGNLVNSYRDREAKVGGMLTGLGDQELADVDEAYRELDARQQQNLVSRGLANTTVVGSTQRGNERERQEARNRVNENIRRQQVGVTSQLSGDTLNAQGNADRYGNQMQQGVLDAQARKQALDAQLSAQTLAAQGQKQSLDAQMSGDKLGFLERRVDSYPSMDQYGQLMMQLGQSGYGGGGAAPAAGGGGAPPGLSKVANAGGTYMGFNSQFMPKTPSYDAYIANLRKNWKDPRLMYQG